MFCSQPFAMLRQMPLFLMRSFSRRNSVTFLHHREALGDTLMLTALARNLKRFRPQIHVAVVSRRPELFYHNPHIDENRGWHVWRSGCTVRAKYSAGDLTGETHAVEIQWRALWRELAEAHFFKPPIDSPAPKLDGVHPEIFLSAGELQAARERFEHAHLGSQKPVVLIGSGGKLKPTHNREWGAANYRALADALQPHAELYQISGEEVLLARGKALPDLRGIPVRQAAAVFAVCDAMLVQEGGLMHVARAVNAPCATLFGGYVLPHQTGYAEQQNFSSRPECSPCIPLLTNCPHLKCMLPITPRKVLQALGKLIAAHPVQPLPEDLHLSVPDAWTPPDFVDREALARERLTR